MKKLTRICWVLSEDKAGMIAQALGLAEAVKLCLNKRALDNGDQNNIIHDLDIRVRLIKRRRPWKWLPAALWPKGVIGVDFVDRQEADLNDPITTPDLIISCGRQAVWPNAEIRRRLKAQNKDCFSIHIQDPKISFDHFDMITTPFHDKLKGENLVETLGSLGRTSRATLDQAADLWRDRLKDLPRPLIAVSIGGDNKVYRYSKDDMQHLGAGLKAIAKKTGGSLVVTSSRRTNPENTEILKEQLAGCSHLYWDGTEENPYFGFLGSADYVVVTCDSVNMVSEACSTGKPVHVFHVDPIRKTKFSIFHKIFEERGLSRNFVGKLENWTYEPLHETSDVAHKLLEQIGWH